MNKRVYARDLVPGRDTVVGKGLCVAKKNIPWSTYSYAKAHAEQAVQIKWENGDISTYPLTVEIEVTNED